MKISAVIPVINEASRIANSIRQAWHTGVDEVIVADGGSTDGTIEIAESSECHLVNSAKGRGNQLNAGVQKATGDIFLFLHADAVLVDDACSQIRRAWDKNLSNSSGQSNPSPDYFFGGFRQAIDDPRWIFRWIEGGNALRIRWQGLAYGDQGIFVSRHAFERVGGFPNEPLMEDFVLSQRLAKLTSAVLLPGPITIDARRWQKNGPLRQTIRNWGIAFAFRMGVSPQRLTEFYRRHDK